MWSRCQRARSGLSPSTLGKDCLTKVLPDPTGNGSALHIASSYGHDNFVQALLERDANPNLPGTSFELPQSQPSIRSCHHLDALGDTPFHDACRNGHAKTVESLLTWDANPSVRSTSTLLAPMCFTICCRTHLKSQIIGVRLPFSMRGSGEGKSRKSCSYSFSGVSQNEPCAMTSQPR